MIESPVSPPEVRLAVKLRHMFYCCSHAALECHCDKFLRPFDAMLPQADV